MSSSEEKTEEASDHKLREARKQGDVAVSKNLTSALGFAAVCLVIWMGADLALQQLQVLLLTAFETLASKGHGEKVGHAIEKMLSAALYVVVPLLLLAAVVSVMVSLVQTRGMFSAEPLKFKFERLNPGESLKNLFSTKQLGVLVQMLLAMGLLGGILFWTFKSFVGPMINGIYESGSDIGGISAKALTTMFLGAAVVYVALGLLDYVQQYLEYLKRNRMSKTDRKREHKENEGSPEVKAELRARRLELAGPLHKLGVGGANVVITNPTHFAVALYYEAGVVILPMVVAKGQDDMALSMRAEARRLAIPIMENPPLARALYRSIELGECIGDEHLEAVADVFRWVGRLKTAVPSS